MLPMALRVGHRLLKAVFEQGSVRKAGQRVVVCEMCDPLLRLLAFGDVLHCPHRASKLASVVELDLSVLQNEVRFAVRDG